MGRMHIVLLSQVGSFAQAVVLILASYLMLVELVSFVLEIYI